MAISIHVGQIVHYIEDVNNDRKIPEMDVRAAIITKVYPRKSQRDPIVADLCVFNSNSLSFKHEVEMGKEAGNWKMVDYNPYTNEPIVLGLPVYEQFWK